MPRSMVASVWLVLEVDHDAQQGWYHVYYPAEDDPFYDPMVVSDMPERGPFPTRQAAIDDELKNRPRDYRVRVDAPNCWDLTSDWLKKFPLQ